MIFLDFDLHLASRTVEEGPSDTGRGPSTEDTLPNAFNVEDMSATKDDRWLISKATDHADTAEVVF